MADAEIDALEAGVDLDKLIATEVFGLQIQHRACVVCDGHDEYLADTYKNLRGEDTELWLDVPSYSTEIAAAWLVVEHLCAGEFFFKMNYEFEAGGGCFAAFDDRGCGDSNPPYGARGDTLPLAICRTALKAVLANKLQLVGTGEHYTAEELFAKLQADDVDLDNMELSGHIGPVPDDQT